MALFFVLLLIPFLELSLFIKVAAHIGVLETIILCIITAMIGSNIIRQQGIKAWTQGMTSMQRQANEPVNDLFTGLCLFIAGMLLIIPGFITDGIGFLLLIPKMRVVLYKALQKYFFKTGYTQYNSTETIEVDYTVIDDDQNNR